MIYKLMLKINNFSKKATIIYLCFLTLFTITSLCLLITGLIFYTSTLDPKPSFALAFIISSSICLFIELLTVILSTIASNYVSKINRNQKN